VFYAAGTDEEDPERVNDLKVLPRFAAVEEHEVTDAEGLEAFEELLEAEGVDILAIDRPPVV
jgi:tryptophan synthase beta subunit